MASRKKNPLSTNGTVNRKSGRVIDEKPRIIRPSGTGEVSFYDLVYEVARQIPRGRVTSYGAIAAALGAKSSSRMVGWAMNNCHLAKPAVPAHRVVNRIGVLSGKHHFADPDQMERKLNKEGILIRNDQVVDFPTKFWDPALELSFR